MRNDGFPHLVFNYITNPGILLLIPILFLLFVVLAGASALVYTFFQNLSQLDLSTMQTLRQTLLDGQLTLVVVSFSFIFLMIFVGFFFLSFQSKRYFDEIYTIVMRMNARIKKIESESRFDD